jgi:hypothetical protein
LWVVVFLSVKREMDDYFFVKRDLRNNREL